MYKSRISDEDVSSFAPYSKIIWCSLCPAAVETHRYLSFSSLKLEKSWFCAYQTLIYSTWQKSLPHETLCTSITAAGDALASLTFSSVKLPDLEASCFSRQAEKELMVSEDPNSEMKPTSAITAQALGAFPSALLFLPLFSWSYLEDRSLFKQLLPQLVGPSSSF